MSNNNFVGMQEGLANASTPRKKSRFRIEKTEKIDAIDSIGPEIDELVYKIQENRDLEIASDNQQTKKANNLGRIFWGEAEKLAKKPYFVDSSERFRIKQAEIDFEDEDNNSIQEKQDKYVKKELIPKFKIGEKVYKVWVGNGIPINRLVGPLIVSEIEFVEDQFNYIFLVRDNPLLMDSYTTGSEDFLLSEEEYNKIQKVREESGYYTAIEEGIKKEHIRDAINHMGGHDQEEPFLPTTSDDVLIPAEISNPQLQLRLSEIKLRERWRQQLLWEGESELLKELNIRVEQKEEEEEEEEKVVISEEEIERNKQIAYAGILDDHEDD